MFLSVVASIIKAWGGVHFQCLNIWNKYFKVEQYQVHIKNLKNLQFILGISYRTRAIITRGLYTFYPVFKVQNRFFKGLFFLKFWPYVWLVFKSGFKSRAGYNGARTVVLTSFHLEFSSFWIFLSSNNSTLEYIFYRTRAIITRSWLETALEY